MCASSVTASSAVLAGNATPCVLSDDSDLEQFAVNSRRAPKPILLSQAPNELATRRIDAWSSRASRTAPPAANEGIAVPPIDGGRLNQHQRVAPPRPHPSSNQPQQAVRRSNAPIRARQDGQLVAQGSISSRKSRRVDNANRIAARVRTTWCIARSTATYDENVNSLARTRYWRRTAHQPSLAHRVSGASYGWLRRGRRSSSRVRSGGGPAHQPPLWFLAEAVRHSGTADGTPRRRTTVSATSARLQQPSLLSYLRANGRQSSCRGRRQPAYQRRELSSSSSFSTTHRK